MGLYLHSYVHKRNGKKTLYIYARLVDEVHSTHALSATWTRHLETPGIDLRKKINWPTGPVKFLNNWPLQNSTGPRNIGPLRGPI